MTAELDTLQIADAYLASRGCTLWGRAFDVQDDKTRPIAAGWFIKEMMAFSNYLANVRSNEQLELEL